MAIGTSPGLTILGVSTGSKLSIRPRRANHHRVHAVQARNTEHLLVRRGGDLVPSDSSADPPWQVDSRRPSLCNKSDEHAPGLRPGATLKTHRGHYDDFFFRLPLTIPFWTTVTLCSSGAAEIRALGANPRPCPAALVFLLPSPSALADLPTLAQGTKREHRNSILPSSTSTLRTQALRDLVASPRRRPFSFRLESFLGACWFDINLHTLLRQHCMRGAPPKEASPARPPLFRFLARRSGVDVGLGAAPTARRPGRELREEGRDRVPTRRRPQQALQISW